MVQKWTGKSRSNNFFQALLKFFVKYGGRYTAYFILYLVAAFYTCLPSIRKNAGYYVKRRFKSKAFENLRHIYKLNFTFGKILIDRAAFGLRGEIEIISPQEDKQLCKDLLAKGKGLIIITAHCGCWQMAMSSFDFMEGEKFVVYHQTKEDIDKHAHELSGKKAPVNFIEPSGFDGGAIEIMSALEKKGIVCMMGDRTFGGKENSVETDFLGGKIQVPFSIYRIAGALNSPIAVIFFPYCGKGRVDSFIAKTFYVQDKGKNPQNYIPEAQTFTNSLSDFIQKYPHQFFNYFDMWN
ncbi:MAG: lysophospholipid acyltransferase family protein [Elusimicrobiota bacterium]|jgi:predicted LPLAT superfamily acyltransferase|nr:lysophospholipid acyltransferase family protein [Elusimicrobiota bacterium]